jgi:two-component system, chemotaxis family, sensor kinase CheA
MRMDDILRDFVIETAEAIDVVDSELVKFEQEPNNGAILAQIFRLVHTVKGTCGFLGLPRLESLSHAAETVIGQFRDGVPVTQDAVSLILDTIDRIKLIIGELDRLKTEPDGSDDDLIGSLEAMAKTQAGLRFATTEAPQHTTGTLVYQVLERPLKPGEVSLDDLERAFRTGEEPDIAVFETAVAEVIDQPAPDMVQTETMIAAPVEDVAQAAHVMRGGEVQSEAAATADIASRTTIRVNVETLDHLMTMVSELVLTRNQLMEIARSQTDAVFKMPLQRLSNITAELQDAVMKTRMQPIGAAWAKLPRLVRDLSVELRKEIDLETTGSETEIDRHVLELIRDPLTHMIRNSADHGIEQPEDRVLVGKKRRGVIRVAAFQEGGYIILEISDDGRGIDKARVIKKALQQGLLTEDAVSRMSDSQIYKLIFRAGFSTAENVTNVSGRGVGMDVVATNVEQIGGTLDVHSTMGRGTTISIKIPVTLAIAAALIVEVAKSRFAIPQIAVMELVRARDGSDARVESVSGAKVLRLREQLLPLASLRTLLEVGGGSEADDKGFIVVCQVAGRRFGLIVDSVLQTEEIVVKPVSQVLRAIRSYSGTTILGDGSVVMIVDPGGVATEMRVITQDTNRFEQADATVAAEDADPATSLLIFRAGGDGFKAVPLALVTRLEEIEASSIEYASGAPMVQYRGKLMPLLSVGDMAGKTLQGRVQLLVFAHGARSAGLIVDQIIDIVDERLEMAAADEREGLVGSAIVNGKATDIVDVSHYLPFDLEGKEGNDNKRQKTVLLIDDSDFFTAMIGPVIKAAGYRLAVSSQPATAAKLITSGQVDFVAIDVENAKLSGFEFARRIKSDGKLAHLPVVGLVARASAALVQRGKECGLDDMIGKFDRQGLVSTIKDLLATEKEAA